VQFFVRRKKKRRKKEAVLDDLRERVFSTVYDAGLQLHRELGPGLLESLYESVLAARLEKLGLHVERQRAIEIVIDGVRCVDAYRVDMLVEGWLVVELKAVEKLSGVHIRQALTYVKLINQPVGLLINFGAEWYKDGTHRIINNAKK
jgi:GxxExxY protein